MSKEVIFADGGLYFTYLNSLKKHYTFNARYSFGDSLSIISKEFKARTENLIKEKDNEIALFPELLKLDIEGQNLASIIEHSNNIICKDNLFDIVAHAKTVTEYENTIFLGTGFENAALTVAIAIIRSIMAGHIKFKVLGEFYYLPALLQKISKQANQSYLIMPYEFLSCTPINEFEKICLKQDLIPIFSPNKELPLNLILQKIEKNEYIPNNHAIQIDKKQQESFYNLIHELFYLPKENSSPVLQIKDKYKEYFIELDYSLNKEETICQKINSGDIPINDCKVFCDKCTPLNPVSLNMTSNKGICKIHHYFKTR
ncbi:MAG: hypothetical protein ACEPOW_02560 [Bacteroidales bacterium]